MSQSFWKTRVETLASAVRAACEKTLAPTNICLVNLTRTMWGEEDDPRIVPCCPIGEIYHFRLSEHRTRYLFGRRWLPIRSRRTLQEFGMEEMWPSPEWAADKGLWCIVLDPRLAAIVRPLIEGFSDTHRIKPSFSGT